MAESTNCPNCGASTKSSILSTNRMLTEDQANFINLITERSAGGYCEKCGLTLLREAKSKYLEEMRAMSARLAELIGSIPVISAQAPTNWQYQILEMVTAQSTTGTGVFSEFASSVTDLFGTQSRTFNRKIAGGEELCKAQLRAKCLEFGGNAIIAADIDYAEVGGEKGMLLVAMAGTAIRVDNADEVFDAERADAFTELSELSHRRLELAEWSDIGMAP